MKIAQRQGARKGHGLLDQRIALCFPALSHLAGQLVLSHFRRQPVCVEVCIAGKGQTVKFQNGPDFAVAAQHIRHRMLMKGDQHVHGRKIGVLLGHCTGFDLPGDFLALSEILDQGKAQLGIMGIDLWRGEAE